MSRRDSETLTADEIAFLVGHPLGRLATVAPDGRPQNNPIHCYYNPKTRTVDVGGHGMAASRKYRNIRTNPQVALVVDEIHRSDPWTIRCLEVRGVAEAIAEPVDSAARTPGAIIRIRPRRIISWGMETT